MSTPTIKLYIDGARYDVRPGLTTGSEIRELICPPAPNLFWDIEDASDTEVPPEVVIRLEDGMRFFTAAPKVIYLDARPYRVPAGAISEHQLRTLPTPNISNDLAIWHDIPDAKDWRLLTNELIEVTGGERFFSAPESRLAISIVLNARPTQVKKRKLTFEALVALAYETPPNGENVLFTITYSKALAPHHKGSLLPGGILTAKEGTVVNVYHSDKS